MSTATATISKERPLDLRGRPDLVAKPIEFQGTRFWSVKDPVSLRYFQLCDEELFILRQIDGQHSFESIRANFERRFAPRKLDKQELYAFLGTLHREGLVTSSVAGQADELFERSQRAESRTRWQTLSNVLAIRFRGIDPSPVLDAVYPHVRWLFSRAFVAMSFLLVLAAVISLVVYADAFVRRLPRLETFMSFENLLLMAVVLGACKILHELGHALTCKHFGGHCHELGVMFLVFTPCMYCNVSEAWMIRSKWKRIAISAAGICVELTLAAVCTFLWWFSQPGTANSIFLNVMFVCSAGTILFNGNPLLRYDGYFILADLVERPNLQQQSQSVLQRALMRFLGVELRETWTVAHRGKLWLAAYGATSLVYRWVLVIGILFLVHRALKPYGLDSLAQVLAIGIVGGMIAVPAIQAVRFVRESRFKRRGRVSRAFLLAVTAVGCIAWLTARPISWDVSAPVVIEPADATRIHVTVPGTLEEFAPLGTTVQAGDVIAQLKDLKLERAIAELDGQRKVQQLRTEQLQKLQVLERGSASDGAGSQLATAKQALASTERQLQQKQRDLAGLTIVAPRSGTILTARTMRDETPADQLPTWTNTPLDERNIGSFLDSDTTVCLVGSTDKMKAIAVVQQEQIERVAINQTVRIIVDDLQSTVLTGTITDIARVTITDIPPELVAKRLLAEEATTSYTLNIALDPNQPTPLLYAAGRAKIAVEPQSIAELIYQKLCDTFRVDL